MISEMKRTGLPGYTSMPSWSLDFVTFAGVPGAYRRGCREGLTGYPMYWPATSATKWVPDWLYSETVHVAPLGSVASKGRATGATGPPRHNASNVAVLSSWL